MFTQLQIRFRLPGTPIEAVRDALPGILGDVATARRFRVTEHDDWRPLDDPPEFGSLRALEYEMDRGKNLVMRDVRGRTEGTWWIGDAGALSQVPDLFRRLLTVAVAGCEAWTEFADSRPAVGSCPIPPLAEDRLIWLGPTSSIAEHYSSEERFRRGWNEMRELGDHRLCLRATDLHEVQAQLFRLNWDLARLALGGSQYPLRIRTEIPAERALVEAEPSRLVYESYDPARATQVFEAEVGPGERLSARDIVGLRRTLGFEVDEEDGRDVRVIRVRFADATTAEREKRPLFDLGVEVWVGDTRLTE